jgi:hypothetical protein
MTFWDYFFIAIGLYVAFRMGQASIIALLKEEMRERILSGRTSDSAVRDIIDVADKEQCEFRLERVHNNYYAYAKGGEFLAQGQNFNALFSAIKQRFPGRSFRVDPKDTDLTVEESQELIRAVVATFGDKQ